MPPDILLVGRCVYARLQILQHLASLFQRQPFTLGVVEIGHADAVVAPAGGDLALEVRVDGVDRRPAVAVPVRVRRMLPAPGRVDRGAGPLAGAIGPDIPVLAQSLAPGRERRCEALSLLIAEPRAGPIQWGRVT